MDKLKNKILQMSFSKLWKRFLPLALALLLLGGIAVGICFRPQISEGIAYVQQQKQVEESEENKNISPAGISPEYGSEHHRWKKDIFENAPISEPSFGAKLLLGGFVLLCCLIFGVYWLAFAAWMYQIGNLAHMCGPLWLLAGLAGNLLAGVCFLFLRSILRKQCPSCGQWLPKKAKFCVHCGTILYAKCPACGKECGMTEHYCAACGHSLENGNAPERKGGENA